MKRSLRITLAIASLAAVSFWSASAFAYSYTFSCGPSWTSLPVSYWINQNGSGDVPFSTITSVIEDSFASWGDPCCSNFEAAYQGTTALTANNNQGRVVLSWTEDGWNPQWGSVNQTIGITFSQVYNNCSISQAPILFNGVGFRFSTDGSGTDVQSIATHEIGHLLGLGHSSVFQATMYASYPGGTAQRSLHQDDVDGVCSLYTRSCSCNRDSDCGDGQICAGNMQCEEIPCRNDSDCEPGLECNTNTGDCVIPPCSDNSDCADGFVCRNDICVSSCPVCRQNCSTNADCGGNGFCVDNPEGGKVCIVLCGQNSECPGDSVCYQIPDGQGGTAYACGAPDAQNSLCPMDYTCRSSDPVDECSDDSDCDAGDSCQSTVNGKKCQTAAADPCDGVTCDVGQECQDGACVDTSPNNNTGNNATGGSPNNTTNGGGGGNNTSDGGSGGDDEDTVIIVIPEDDGTNGQNGGGCGGCASSPTERAPAAPLLILGLFAAVRLRRRR